MNYFCHRVIWIVWEELFELVFFSATWNVIANEKKNDLTLNQWMVWRKCVCSFTCALCILFPLISLALISVSVTISTLNCSTQMLFSFRLCIELTDNANVIVFPSAITPFTHRRDCRDCRRRHWQFDIRLLWGKSVCVCVWIVIVWQTLFIQMINTVQYYEAHRFSHRRHRPLLLINKMMIFTHFKWKWQDNNNNGTKQTNTNANININNSCLSMRKEKRWQFLSILGQTHNHKIKAKIITPITIIIDNFPRRLGVGRIGRRVAKRHAQISFKWWALPLI